MIHRMRVGCCHGRLLEQCDPIHHGVACGAAHVLACIHRPRARARVLAPLANCADTLCSVLETGACQQRQMQRATVSERGSHGRNVKKLGGDGQRRAL